MLAVFATVLFSVLPLVSGHASIWHPSMLGFNVSGETFPYDNRPVSPLSDMTFDKWWFHGHLAFPPHPEDVFELPAGTNVTTQIGCNKGATDFFASSDGGDIRNGNDPCPGSPTSEYHTTGIDDVKGCALAIAYKDDFNATQPEDFTVFSINQTCVWSRFTEFSVPARMPPCPNGKCICAWFWIHSQDSGGEQNYMNGFQCNITNSVSDVPVAKSQVPRRCGADSDFGKQLPAPGNCTYGAKQPFYWFQAERNNMNEGTYAPPFYLDLYGFLDGPQDDIFQDSYTSVPAPGDNQTALPVLNNLVRLPVPNVDLLGSSFVVPTGTPSSSGADPSTPSATASTSPPSSTAGTGAPGGKGSSHQCGPVAPSTDGSQALFSRFKRAIGVGTYTRKQSMERRSMRALWGF
ncbi:hypothetical protein PENSPDRAFT_634710 [Peniophora sp. CONT]|nr:hypothetical protein PENSPDRAFT_634710 [Peniophora sp. CONT]